MIHLLVRMGVHVFRSWDKGRLKKVLIPLSFPSYSMVRKNKTMQGERKSEESYIKYIKYNAPAAIPVWHNSHPNGNCNGFLWVFSSKDKELLLIDFCRDSKQSNQREVICVCLAFTHVSETLRWH